jgi:hypothetical protein
MIHATVLVATSTPSIVVIRGEHLSQPSPTRGEGEE